MGIFTRKKVSKAPVDQWDSKDVQAWAKSVAGLPKPHRKALKPINGKGLINLTSEDLDTIFGGDETTMGKNEFLKLLQSMKESSHSGKHSSPPEGTDENCSDNARAQIAPDAAKSSSTGHFPPLGLPHPFRQQKPIPEDNVVKSTRHAQTVEPLGMRAAAMQDAPPSQRGPAYETATIDATPPGPLKKADCETSCPAQKLHEGVNVTLSFDPNPSRQELSHAVAEFESDSVPISEKSRNGNFATESSRSLSNALEPLQVIHTGSQPNFGQFSSVIERSTVKSASGSIQTVDKVSVHSQKLETVSAERHELRRDLSKDVEVQLMQHFLSFANFSNHGELLIDMDGVNFAKYCADTRIIGGGVKSRDVDLAFMGAKVKGTRRINFDHFLRALKTLGERRGLSLSDMVEVCLMNEGPINNSATKVSNIRLHDDKSTYTGVYKRGGPDTMVGGAKSLQQITNRKPADARGVEFSRYTGPFDQTLPRRHVSDTTAQVKNLGAGLPLLTPSMMSTLPTSLSMPEPSRRAATLDNSVHVSERTLVTSTHQIQDWDDLDKLERVFASFAVFGKGRAANIAAEDIRMDSKSFAKLMKEAGVMYGKLNLTRVDLCFTKCCDKVSKRMSFEQFQLALEECAAARGDDTEVFKQAITFCQPMVHGTVAGRIKWHDDRSMYTGVHARGGPTNVDKKISFKDIVNRDARPASGRQSSVNSWAS